MIKTSKSLEFRSQFWTFWNNTSVSCSKTRKDSGFVIFGTPPFQQNNFHEKILIFCHRNIFSKILFSKKTQQNQEKSGEMLMFCIFWKCLYWFFNENFWFSKKIENKIVEKIFRWQKNNIFSWKLFCWKGGVPNITNPLSLRVLEQDTEVLFQNVQNWDRN